MKKLLTTSALCLGFVGAAAIDARAQNNLFVTNFGNTSLGGTVVGNVVGYNTMTKAVVSTFSGGEADSTIINPLGIATDPTSGALYVTSINPSNPASPTTSVSSILRLNSNGSINTVVLGSQTPSASGLPVTALQNPKGLTIGPGNQLYVANGGNTGAPSFLGVANPATGSYANTLGGPGSSLNAPFPVTYDGSRYLYAGNIDNTVTRFDTSINDTTGTPLNLVAGLGAANIVLLNGLAVGPDGALYATDGTRGDVLRIATPAAATSTFSLFTNGLIGPEGLAFEPVTNNLFVANDDNTIQRIIPVGTAASGFTTGAVDPSFNLQESAGSGPTFLAFSPIPEPSTYALFGVAGAVMLVFGLKRRQQLTLRA